MSNKIKKFKVDIDYYCEKAMDKVDNGDYIGGLELLRHVQDCFLTVKFSEDDLSIRIEIADIYSCLGLFEESNKEYFRLLAFDYCLDEVFYGIIRNYCLLENPELALHYAKLAGELDAFNLEGESEFNIEAFDFIQEVAIKPFELLKPHDNSRMIKAVKGLISEHENDLAKHILASIPKKSNQRIEAKNLTALLELSEGKSEEGLELCEQILKEDPKNIFGLTTKIIALDLKGDKKELKNTAKILDDLNITEWPDVAKVALCFCQCNNNALAYKYLKRSLEYNPYDKELLTLFLLASFNLNNLDSVRITSSTLRAIYPTCVIAAYYAREGFSIIEGGKKPKFELIADLPKDVRLQYSILLDKALKDSLTPEKFLCLVRENPIMLEVTEFALRGDNLKIAEKLGCFLASSKESFHSVMCFLLDPYYPDTIKKEIMLSALNAKSSFSKTFSVVIKHKIYWFTPKAPIEFSCKKFKSAYYRVYVSLAFLNILDEKKLNKVAKLFYKRYIAAMPLKSREAVKLECLAVHIALQTTDEIKNSHDSFMHDACTYYGADLNEYKEFLKLLDKEQ